MKLYKYTILKQDGTKQVLAPRKKMDLEELQGMVGGLIEIVPADYYSGQGWNQYCTVYMNEEARFDSNNKRNPHFNVLHDNNDSPWDIVGVALREEVYHEPKELK